MPSRVLNFQTPLAALASEVSVCSTSTLAPHIFESVVYVHIHKNQHSKLDMCALRCVFDGYYP